jgi:hypothetical protein
MDGWWHTIEKLSQHPWVPKRPGADSGITMLRIGGTAISLSLISCSGGSKDSGFDTLVGVEWGEEVVCESAVSGFDRFKSVASERGLPENISGIEEGPTLGGGLIAEDMDGDGDIDLVFANIEGQPRVFENDGQGFFSETIGQSFSWPERFYTLPTQHAAADMNADGRPDLLAVGNGLLVVFWNEGALDFSEPEALWTDPLGPIYTSLGIGDADGDGDLDIAIPTVGAYHSYSGDIELELVYLGETGKCEGTAALYEPESSDRWTGLFHCVWEDSFSFPGSDGLGRLTVVVEDGEEAYADLYWGPISQRSDELILTTTTMTGSWSRVSPDAGGVSGSLSITAIESELDGPPTAADLIFRNNNGTLSLLATVQPDERTGASLAAGFTDRDGDGDMDLLVLSDFADRPDGGYPPTAFYRNDGPVGDPVWVNDAVETGSDMAIAGMGWSSGDWNRDGALDYCMSDIGTVACLLSVAELGTWIRGDATIGLTPPASAEQADRWSAWGLEIEDLDNNGLLDAVAAGGKPFPEVDEPNSPDIYNQPDAIWEGVSDEGLPAFVDRTIDMEFGDEADHYGLVTADLDGDGFLEIVIAGAPGPAVLWQNSCSDSAWVEFDLVGPEANAQAIGAQLTLVAGDLTRTKEIYGTRAMAQSPSRIHVGLGSEETIDSVMIHWPDGQITALDALPVRRVIRVFHPDHL